MHYVILRKTEKNFYIDDLWLRENLLSCFKIEDKDFLEFEQSLNLEISKIHDRYINASKEERIKIVFSIIVKLLNDFSIEFYDWFLKK